MDGLTVVFLFWGIIFFIVFPIEHWSMLRHIKRDLKCAVEHKGKHTFLRQENVEFSNSDGGITGRATFTVLWCPICQRKIDVSWSDRTWVAIPLAKQKIV